MGGELTILVPARDEEDRIGTTIAALREAAPDARIVVGDDGSRDGTARCAEEAGARVLRLPRLGKGQALTAAERSAPAGTLLLVDADLGGDLPIELGSLLREPGDLIVASFAERQGGGFGIAKRAARWLIRVRSGVEAREPLSGQRVLSPAARAACFPLAPGFGCEVRMTIDAALAGLVIREVEVPLRHRATARDLGGFAHRGRQLADAVAACGPLAVNFRGLRLPLVGWAAPLAAVGGQRKETLAVTVAALAGLADDLWSGPERGWPAHLRAGRTTGVVKLLAIPAAALAATGSVAGALLVGLSANALNQLDTRPGRALKAFVLASLLLSGSGSRRAALRAVLVLPYDLRERVMLGDAGSNALGAVVGFRLVHRLPGRARWAALAALAGLNFLGEHRSLGTLIESTPILRELDALGRRPATEWA